MIRGELCSTPFGITEVGTRSRRDARRQPIGVLNAFRHHWIRHAQPRVTADAASMCSTPFGITEFGTRLADARPMRGRPVLNAFRHH